MNLTDIKKLEDISKEAKSIQSSILATRNRTFNGLIQEAIQDFVRHFKAAEFATHYDENSATASYGDSKFTLSVSSASPAGVGGSLTLQVPRTVSATPIEIMLAPKAPRVIDASRETHTSDPIQQEMAKLEKLKAMLAAAPPEYTFAHRPNNGSVNMYGTFAEALQSILPV